MARSLTLVVLVAVLVGAGCGSDPADAGPAPGGGSITVWFLEHQPDRVRATKANVAAFTEATRIRVRLVPIGDDELPARMAQARASGRLPDVAQLPLDSLHSYASDGLLDTEAAADVLDLLGDETFSQTALTLAGQDSRVIGVPSDGWGQLLIYRRDVFEAAGLRPPATLEDVRRAARRLERDGFGGITLPNAPGENFTAEIFEHIALAGGCQLVDDGGRVAIDTPRCREAFAYYVDLARRGARDGEVTRDGAMAAYFAGRTAMMFWSPFVLDAMAGLRDDARPTCDACAADPAFLARNSGLVGPLAGDGAAPAQYGSISSWGIFQTGGTAAARRFVEYMLSDGYLRWLALSPQGKYPVRGGDAADPERFYAGWERLRSGVDRKAPLRAFYPERAVASLGEGVRAIRRWGFVQGQAALAGELRESQVVSRIVADAVAGRLSPAAAARRLHAEAERLLAPAA